ncbi:MAG: histidinol-phosphatase [Pseudomonadota bacterium]
MAYDVDDLLHVAHLLADAAGAAIRPYFRQEGLGTENKDEMGYDPVTRADRAAERAMRSILAARRPDDGIVGEEFGTHLGSTDITWALDPIDGTRGFVAGTPTWGVLIAASTNDGPVLGVIDQPYIGERFSGAGQYAVCQGPYGTQNLKTRDTKSISDAILFTTFPEVGTVQDKAGFDAVAADVKLVRYGMDCYAYALLASGQIDLVIEAGLKAYDIQAPIGLIEAAGGIVTDWSGGSAKGGGRAVAAANPDIHALALARLAPFE